MEVKQHWEAGKRIAEITIDRDSYNELDRGCPNAGFVMASSMNGTNFYIFPNPAGEFDKAFRPMPERDGYFIYIGIPGGYPERTQEDLENVINNKGRIPLEDERARNLGYVSLKVEETVRKAELV